MLPRIHLSLLALLSAFLVTGCATESRSDAQACGDGQRLDATGMLRLTHAHLAVDPTGTALAVWAAARDAGAATPTVWANEYLPGAGWQGARRLDTDGTGDPYHVDVVGDGQGNAIATWWQDGDDTVRANRYVAGRGWLGVELVSSAESGPPDGAHAALHPDGRAVIVWARWHDARWNVWANRYDPDSATWGTPERFATPEGTGVYARDPRVGIDAQGNAIVVWWTYDRYEIWGNHDFVGSGWQTPRRLDLSPGLEPQVAVDPGGSATLIAMGGGGHALSGYVTARRYTPGTDWLGATAVSAASGPLDGRPSVAVDRDGNVTVVWTQGDGIWANRYAAGVGWVGPQRLDAASAGVRSDSPHVAVNDGGHAAAVWTQWRAGKPSVWLSRHDPATGWSPARRLVEGTDGAAVVNPQVGLDAGGTAHVVWHRFDPETSQLCGAAFQ